MNNFAENPQIEAPEQDFSLPTSQFDPLYNITVAGRGHCPVALADVRYSNGADAAFTRWLLQFGPEILPLASIAYAGWNTGQFALVWGLGSAWVFVILWFSGKFSWNSCGQCCSSSSAWPKSSRIGGRFHGPTFTRRLALSVCCAAAVEGVRAPSTRTLQTTFYDFCRYVEEEPQGDPSYLDDGHLQFYEDFVKLPLGMQCQNMSTTFGVQVALESVFFPWNRTFEIGFIVQQRR